MAKAAAKKLTAIQLLQELEGSVPVVHVELVAKYLAARDKIAKQLSAPVSPLRCQPYGGDNILGVHFDLKKHEKTGKTLDEVALVIYVKKKAPKPELVGPALLDEKKLGVPLDIRVVEKAIPTAGGGRGICSTNWNEGGTAACVVNLEGGGDLAFYLSNAHVLASQIPVPIAGSAVYEVSGGSVLGQIGQLAYWYPRDDNDPANRCDAALAVATHGTPETTIGTGAEAFTLNPIPELHPKPGMRVKKFGAKTGLTRGTIAGVGVGGIKVGSYVYGNQITIRPDTGTVFNDRGDSGSLAVIEDTNQPVGLVFGRSLDHQMSYANSIADVIAAFGINRFATSGATLTVDPDFFSGF